MSWARPEFAPLLLLVAPVALLFWALARVHRRRRARALGERTALLADHSQRRRRAGRLLFAGALLLAGVAAAQPLWGAGGRTHEQRGVDLVVCLDVSRSMLAADLAPSRLEHARREIRALAERARGDRLALVVFAGEATLAVPLTRDLDTFAQLAATADPLTVGRGGSDLGAALDTALAALGRASGEHEAIVLLTDGEDLEEKGLRAARVCAERGITVHCVGLGSPRGAKIPDGDGFLRDRAGNEVVSRMDPARLRRIAEATGGAFAESLATLYEKRILAMARKSFEAREESERKNRFQWPLLGALLFLLAELGLGERR